MKSKWKRIILDLVFIIVLAATIIAFAVYLIDFRTKAIASDDHPLVLVGVPIISTLFLIPIIIAEFDIFYTVRYFLLHGTYESKIKTITNIISCALAILMVVILLMALITTDSNLLVITLIWILIYPIFRVIYFIIGKVSRKKNNQ